MRYLQVPSHTLTRGWLQGEASHLDQGLRSGQLEAGQAGDAQVSHTHYVTQSMGLETQQGAHTVLPLLKGSSHSLAFATFFFFVHEARVGE